MSNWRWYRWVICWSIVGCLVGCQGAERGGTSGSQNVGEAHTTAEKKGTTKTSSTMNKGNGAQKGSQKQTDDSASNVGGVQRPKAVKMSKEQLVAQVAPPPWREFLKGIYAPITTTYKCLKYTPITAAGPKSFVVVVGDHHKGHKLPRLWLMKMDKAGDEWIHQKMDLYDYELPDKEFKQHVEACGRTPKVQVFLSVDDYDWDGKPEALIRHKLEHCGEEEETPPPTRVTVWNLGEKTEKALDAVANESALEGHHMSQQFKTKMDKDINGDGHPDMQIHFEESDFKCNLGYEQHRKLLRTYYWNESTDTYNLADNEEKKWRTQP